MAAIDAYEIGRSEWKEDKRLYGQRVFAIPKANVDDVALVAEYAVNVVWPAETGVGCRRIWRYEIERDFPDRPGMARVTLMYRQLSWGGILAQNPNKGRLMVKIGGQREEIVRDLDDLPIEVPVATAEGLFHWHVIDGTNVILVPYCDLVIDAAVTDWAASTIMALVGKINAAGCTNIGGAAAKTLLLTGAEIVGTLSDDPDDLLWRIQYHMSYNPNTWDNYLAAAYYEIKVRTVDTLDAAGDPDGGDAKVKFEELVADSEDWRRIYDTGDFSTLDALLVW